jgi:hypothetical protein
MSRYCGQEWSGCGHMRLCSSISHHSHRSMRDGGDWRRLHLRPHSPILLNGGGSARLLFVHLPCVCFSRVCVFLACAFLESTTG